MIPAPQSAQNFVPGSNGAPHSGQVAGVAVLAAGDCGSCVCCGRGACGSGCAGTACCGICGGILLWVV